MGLSDHREMSAWASLLSAVSVTFSLPESQGFQSINCISTPACSGKLMVNWFANTFWQKNTSPYLSRILPYISYGLYFSTTINVMRDLCSSLWSCIWLATILNNLKQILSRNLDNFYYKTISNSVYEKKLGKNIFHFFKNFLFLEWRSYIYIYIYIYIIWRP